MKHIIAPLLIILFIVSCKAQNEIIADNTSKISDGQKPKLIVGIVIDQMRYDYLTRFNSKYGDGGFKRMINEGFNCKNNHYNFVPTYTGPGHASVFTGTTPKYHGVIGNDWYDKEIKKSVYCSSDDAVESVGTTDRAGQMSPHRMKTTTFADENRLFTQMRGKTIGIALKDRGAVLPAGHTANAAYWFHGRDEGNWISSTFYMSELPKWVNDFNNEKSVASYFKVWNTYYDVSTYTESGSDLNIYEGGYMGKNTATFPYDLEALKMQNGNFDLIKLSAYGNDMTTDFAIAAIDGEQLGKDDFTDVLAISYSTPDYVGHNFGVNSKEVQDTYIRLDKELERLFAYLDTNVGKNEYTVFLTADHAAVEVPSYLKSVKIPAGYFDSSEFRKKITDFVTTKFGASDLIENISNSQIFLNRAKFLELGFILEDVQQIIANEVIHHKYIDKVYTATTLNNNSFTSGIESLLQNGYHQKRSGDVIYVLDPAVISYSKTGSTHGSSFNYDTHVPLLFLGKGIRHGQTLQRTEITDIAPTMSALLGISFPNAAIGQPLEFVIE